MNRRCAIMLVVVIIANVVLINASSAYAYNRDGARIYADKWAKGANPNYPGPFAGDCTNFVSQALRSGGGYPMHRVGQYKVFDWSHPSWWVRYWGLGVFDWSNSWAVAHKLDAFLLADYPGGWVKTIYEPGQSTPDTTPAYYGDVYFYDWTNDGWIDHASIEVAYWSKDPNSTYSGDLVDQHSSNRYHAIWHLRPYNNRRATTKIRLMRIDSGN